MPQANLFIFIPTFNRPSALKHQIRTLLPQLEGQGGRVRLMVSDNNSDKTDPDVPAMCSGHANIEYRKNFGNIGGNANISMAFIFARKDEFIWILADNDTVTNDAVANILKQISLEVDFYSFRNEPANRPAIEPAQPQRLTHSWSDGWQGPMGWGMGLISSVLYNANTVQASIEDAFFYHNSSFPHLAVACSAAKKRGSLLFEFLPIKEILAEEFSSSEHHGDYSLSSVCMPLLVALFPKDQARLFCLGWLKNHWMGLYANRKRHYSLYLQSKAVLASYGGVWVRALLFVTPVAYFISTPLIKVAHKLKRL